ncbi:hypothetical protein HJ01_00683 [Flavobacterium frigoris PS1]|uniref:Uncharacterized protein n=1 Tax=Flavobacterium frigoris (strain PS1) TaxID=1086011 RepID=H7FNL1_FLAFP|nr:hypothetical protein HJ01_00683 [Flavobacterium frigoris PS1]
MPLIINNAPITADACKKNTIADKSDGSSNSLLINKIKIVNKLTIIPAAKSSFLASSANLSEIIFGAEKE